MMLYQCRLTRTDGWMTVAWIPADEVGALVSLRNAYWEITTAYTPGMTMAQLLGEKA